MKDCWGRQINYLRISVTERCQLKCIYCGIGDNNCKKHKELSVNDLERIVKVMANMGIKKVRLTGGEPLVREDIVDIVERISSISRIKELTMTTNAQLLKEKVSSLKKAGLSSINISLDSLSSEKYKGISGGGEISHVLESIEKVIEEGILPIKINVVLVRGKNDDEIDNFIELTRNHPIDVRFIELMPVGRLGEDYNMRIPSSEILETRPQLVKVEPIYQGQPSVDYKIENYQGRVGLISPMSHNFCDSCNRIRLLNDGVLRPCLGNNLEVSIRDALDSKDDILLKKMIESAIWLKPREHEFNSKFHSMKGMINIGG